MRKSFNRLAALGAACALAACTNGQTVAPVQHAVNPATTGKLEFAVGTANFQGTSTGLNTVVTLRQSNGLSAFLADSPTITGPAGFTVPAAAVGANADAGTNTISSNSQTATSSTTTFGTAGGAFGYGFAPANSNNSGTANYPQNGGGFASAIQGDSGSPIIVGPGAGSVSAGGYYYSGEGFANVYPEPIYAASNAELPYLVGPPAVTDFHTSSYPTGFLGYPSGFTAFAAAPVAGAYSLSVSIPSTKAVYTATGTLTTTTPLPTFATPVFADDAAADGGATVTYVLPAGVTNAIVFAVDISSSSGAITIYSQTATASGTWTISATQGPSGGAPFSAGDSVFVYAAGFDYNPLATGLGGPSALVQSPALPAQADVTLSRAYEAVY